MQSGRFDGVPRHHYFQGVMPASLVMQHTRWELPFFVTPRDRVRMKTEVTPGLVPLLVVREAARAIDFYVRVFDATVLARHEHGPRRHVSHADLQIGDVSFAVTEELCAFASDAPPSLGGSPVALQLFVSDTDAVVARMCEAGASIVFPVQELLGERMARVCDPFGHVWLLRQRLVRLSIEEIQRQRDELFARFEQSSTLEEGPRPPQVPIPRGQIHLILGPVGAGKSTFAAKLAGERSAVRLTLDEWMSTLFSPDRPDSGVMEWYVERAARAVDQIWSVALSITALGGDVLLEIGLLRRDQREAFYYRVADLGLALVIHVLDAPRDVRRERVLQRNQERGATFSMIVPPEVFELASDLWQPLDATECEGREVHFSGE
jgi:uncharacterized glyoxalase superfamily protein PhnB/predicted kinase